MITIKEIKEKMHAYYINNKQLAEALDIEAGTVSSHLSERHSSRLFKVACFYYFETLRLKKLQRSDSET